jgi:hypothetical protein
VSLLRLPARAYTVALIVLCAAPAKGDGRVAVKLKPAMKEYCHMVRFPQGWTISRFSPDGNFPLSITHSSDYEFRVRGLLGTAFLVAGVTRYSPELQWYTTNKYLVDLSDPKFIPHAIDNEAWSAATTVPMSRKDIARGAPRPSGPTIEFQGHLFAKSGMHWSIYPSRLSPDGTILVLQSWRNNGTYKAEDVPFGAVHGRQKGQLFWDIFLAEKGKKLFTIVGSSLDADPDGILDLTAWVTERYLIIELGERKQQCLVCEFCEYGSPASGK